MRPRPRRARPSPRGRRRGGDHAARSVLIGTSPAAHAPSHGSARARDHERAGPVRRRVDAAEHAGRVHRAAGALGQPHANTSGSGSTRPPNDPRVAGARRRRCRSGPAATSAILVEVAARRHLLLARGNSAAQRWRRGSRRSCRQASHRVDARPTTPRAAAETGHAADEPLHRADRACPGSGKTQAIRALEDLGYFCVDNLPVALIPTFAELTLRTGGEITARRRRRRHPRAVAAQDVSRHTSSRCATMPGLEPRLIFLDASDAALVRRFSETPAAASARRATVGQRGHPRRARAAGADPRDGRPDHRHDRHDRARTAARVHGGVASTAAPSAGPVVTFLSFGFKHGVPLDADLVFDARFLPNPHFVPELRPHTGRDPEVRAFLEQYEDYATFLERVGDLLAFLLPRYAAEGKSYVTVAIGCTGGKHRRWRSPRNSKRRMASVAGSACACGIATSRRSRTGQPGTRTRRTGTGLQGTGTKVGPLSSRPSGRTMAETGQQGLGVVVVTHGQLAHELVNAAEMIAGEQVRFEAVALGWHDDSERGARPDRGGGRPRARTGRRADPDRHVRRHAEQSRDHLPRGRQGRGDHRRQPADAGQARQPRGSNDGLLGIARQVREHAREAIRVASDLMRPDAGS